MTSETTALLIVLRGVMIMDWIALLHVARCRRFQFAFLKYFMNIEHYILISSKPAVDGLEITFSLYVVASCCCEGIGRGTILSEYWGNIICMDMLPPMQ